MGDLPVSLGNCRLLQIAAARPPLPGGAFIRFPALGQILGKSRQAILFKPQGIRIDVPQTPELLQVCPGDAARQDKMDVEAVVLLSVFQNIYVFCIQTQAGVFPFEPTEEVLEQPLGILYRCGEIYLVKGQCGKKVGRGEIGMQQSPQPPLCMPLIEPLLNLCCRLTPLPSFLWMGIYWIDSHLQILPTVIFFSALMSLFFYLGIMQKIVWVMGWGLAKIIKLSGAESLACAGNVFLGMTEAPLAVKEYVPKMTTSELVLIMTSGMATMSGGVLAAYIGMLGGGDTALEMEFAKHLLSASVMAAPGAIALSKIIMPQKEEIDNTLNITKEKLGKNPLDAIANGTADGLKFAANIAAMLLVFYALIAGTNAILGWISFPAMDEWIKELSGGRYTDLSLQAILAFVFYPIIWLTGIPAGDIGLVGQLFGEKLILTEFVGYQSMAQMLHQGAFSCAKSAVMAAYVLCGFANFASVGILIGAVGGIAPQKRHILTQYGMHALLASSLVALMSAAMIGMFM